MLLIQRHRKECLIEPESHALGFVRKQEVGVKNICLWLTSGRWEFSPKSPHIWGVSPNRKLGYELQDDIGAGQLESRKYPLLGDGVLTT